MSNALIWGAHGGMGRALLAELTTAGYTPIALSRQADGLTGLTPHVVEVDPTQPHTLPRAMLEISHITTHVNAWVYSVGDIASVRVADMSPETFDRILAANLLGAFYAYHYSLPLLTEQANVVFIGAVSERMRLPGLAAYAAAKAGLEAFVETLAKEEQRKRKVLLVRPGAVNTPFWHKVPFRMPANALTPAALAQTIVQAMQAGQTGVLNVGG